MITKIALIFLALMFVLLPATFIMVRIADAIPFPPTPSPDAQADTTSEIEQAIREALEEEKNQVPLLFMYETKIDHITISESGDWATAWITPVDPETGQEIPVEPGLVFVKREDGQWQATLPSNPEWVLEAQNAPADLISEELSAAIQVMTEISAEAVPQAALSGYYLPWTGGDTMYLTQSVAHDRYTPSGNAHYAFDFAKPGYPSGLFNVLAAKSGRVTQAVWRHPNGDPNNTNFLVIQDLTTSPVSYQLYMHLAQNSIPAELRVVGAPVRQGQFIAIADDTGVSSGNHLHFMVHTNPTSYWGRSVDITFVDVPINGGRPRIQADLPYCDSGDVCSQTQTAYVSRNFMNPDFTPPTGGIYTPAHSSTISANIVRLSGWARDDSSGLGSVQFIARSAGGWISIGNPFTSTSFSYDWDLCASNVPDGPVSIALQIRDKAFNQASGLPGLTHFTKNYTCPAPPPVCVPNANQVALFADPDYTGACVVLGSGSYTSASALGSLGVDNAASVQTGSNVQATLYMNSNLQGRGETFIANDSNLADNLIGMNTTSSVLVQTRSTAPGRPRLVFPADGATFQSDGSLSLAWDNGGSTLQYRARLLSGGLEVLSVPWQSSPAWHLNTLPAGTYTWQVKAKSGSLESDWSSARTLQIQSTNPGTTPPVQAPFVDNMETQAQNWSNSGNWDLNQEDNHTSGGTISYKYDTSSREGYDTGAPNSGYLTTPPIQIPQNSAYYLRFWYLYETEGPGLNWDQRWVQISRDGGPYVNLFQLSDEAPNFWLLSPAVPLQPYAGHTIQIRFYFATLDSAFNNYRGWFVDDFMVTDQAPPSCQDADNSFIQATQIQPGALALGEICPGGDVDYYKFLGIAGDQVGVQIQAQNIGSALDSYLYLLDIDGSSVLAENDDLVLSQRTDSWVTYRLTRTGTYYVKLRSWDHPSSGGADFHYTLKLIKENVDPIALFTYPGDGQPVPRKTINLRVEADDPGSGISHVQFLWHAPDWQTADWIVLGEDWDGSDGWNLTFDVSSVPNQIGMALYARVYDWAGNWIGTGAWNLTGPGIYLPLIYRSR